MVIIEQRDWYFLPRNIGDEDMIVKNSPIWIWI